MTILEMAYHHIFFNYSDVKVQMLECPSARARLLACKNISTPVQKISLDQFLVQEILRKRFLMSFT